MKHRSITGELLADIAEGPPLIRAVFGPRQVGKTTAARHVVAELGWPSVFESADSPVPLGAEWISTHWNRARQHAASGPAMLVLDEIQKISGWSETVKLHWDHDRAASTPLTVCILGSSALLLQQGLTESLSGRFFSYSFTHWGYSEMRDSFGWSLDEWIYYGGYPGSVALKSNEEKWKQYVSDSLIETVLARDVMQSHTINKPALLRQLFGLATVYPAHIFSYNKMLGQLQDAGNTTTLAGYLDILAGSFLVKGLELFTKGIKRRRGSSPKLIVLNNALLSAVNRRTFDQVHSAPEQWGWLVENAVGAHLYNQLSTARYDIFYWRDGDQEVDFVVQSGKDILAFEVKSGREGKLSGLQAFKRRYPTAQTMLVGASGVPLEEFFSTDPDRYFAAAP